MSVYLLITQLVEEARQQIDVTGVTALRRTKTPPRLTGLARTTTPPRRVDVSKSWYRMLFANNVAQNDTFLESMHRAVYFSS